MRYYLLNTDQLLDFDVAGKSMLPDNWMHYERTAGHYILYLTISGAFHLCVDDEKYSFYPGDVFLMKPNAHHIGFKQSAVTFYWIHFQMQNVQIIDCPNYEIALQTAQERGKLLLPMHFKLPHIENTIILINQLIHHYKSNSATHIRNCLFSAVLYELQQQTALHAASISKIQKKSRRFEEILAYIEGNYLEDLTISTLADMFGYNPKYLVRLFQKQTGTTIKGYITRTRLKVAEALLLNTNEPIAVVATKSGFLNEYYFMRCFKQKYNMTPSQYRNTYYLQVMTKY